MTSLGDPKKILVRKPLSECAITRLIEQKITNYIYWTCGNNSEISLRF